MSLRFLLLRPPNYFIRGPSDKSVGIFFSNSYVTSAKSRGGRSVKIYATNGSPPSRAVWMALETLRVDYEWVETSPPKGDTQTPEFLKINPQHTIPVLVDGDLTITESKAILLHLARTYGDKDDDAKSLYPRNPKLRSLVEQRLFFDQSSVWGPAGKLFVGLFVHKRMYEPSAVEDLKKTFRWCEDFVKPTGFIAGTPGMSIADLPTLATYTSLRACGLLAPADYPLLEKWAERCSKLVKNYEECNLRGVETISKGFHYCVEKYTTEAST